MTEREVYDYEDGIDDEVRGLLDAISRHDDMKIGLKSNAILNRQNVKHECVLDPMFADAVKAQDTDVLYRLAGFHEAGPDNVHLFVKRLAPRKKTADEKLADARDAFVSRLGNDLGNLNSPNDPVISKAINDTDGLACFFGAIGETANEERAKEIKQTLVKMEATDLTHRQYTDDRDHIGMLLEYAQDY